MADRNEIQPRPTFVPRTSSGHNSAYTVHDRTRPPAATFEPERWSKAWKAGEEGDAIYRWSPKPKGDLQRVGEMLSEGVDTLLRAGGEDKTIDTPKGKVKYTQGGLISNIRKVPFALGGRIYNSNDAAAMTPETAVHEKFGHVRGKGAGYDFTSRMLGLASSDPVKEFGLKQEDAEFFRPSEIYAYTTQPMGPGSYEDMKRYAEAMKNPKFAEYFEKHKNPESDWDFNRMMEFQPKAPVADPSIMNDPAMIAFKKRQAELAGGKK